MTGVRTDDDLADKLEKPDGPDEQKYEKDFTTGQVGLSIIMGTPATNKDGKRFKVVVEHGELYLECVDSFEEIFEISKDLIG